jgi:hypothetical protein
VGTLSLHCRHPSEQVLVWVLVAEQVVARAQAAALVKDLVRVQGLVLDSV